MVRVYVICIIKEYDFCNIKISIYMEVIGVFCYVLFNGIGYYVVVNVKII